MRLVFDRKHIYKLSCPICVKGKYGRKVHTGKELETGAFERFIHDDGGHNVSVDIKLVKVLKKVPKRKVS